MIQATNHISNMAKESQVYFDLGKLLSSQQMININFFYNHSIQQYFDYYDSLKAYLGSSFTEHNNACKFLAMFTAYNFGVEQRSYYDWKQVRTVAEGLWGSMYETPDIFILRNIPLIDSTIKSLKEKVDEFNSNSLNISEIKETDQPPAKKPKNTRVRRESELGSDDDVLKALIQNIYDNK